MGIFNLFSGRKRMAKKAGQPDVYKYDILPEKIRIQIVHIWSEAIAGCSLDEGAGQRPVPVWNRIEKMMCKEHGLFALGDRRDSFLNCQTYFMTAPFDEAADLIELTFRVIENVVPTVPGYRWPQYGISMGAHDAIRELNHRFQEHCAGYQYEGGILLRVDSQFIHAEVVKSALSLMSSTKGFSGPEQEFMRAHEHYRHGRSHEAMVEALKSFESTMKAICSARKWTYDPKASASGLIKTIFDNELVPKYLETHFAGLRSVLEAGLPTVRNKNAGHGQGATPIVVPGYMAAYALHMAAANIVMLVEAHNAKK